ncbi:O-antigen/teichoic acid export membrane protein [Diaminobutyricimonas aerilata]|uniref:O-antigen/teichoic acid export membrane protein n=1 Tax=Diaminobutyricimonas aerilata TaxID=1162967 RepID=A0A2M9CH63_9MICO|nr:oligosaccharide flippase family protein [Diaminobutyricimonas aerilata]PJJ71228.1 O-antigen/teichoic acid export membrane protein [Diaminobutyricimonas aerilata]
MKIGLASALGILATFGFQIITARVLGAERFGVLSAFFAIVNVAAFGSASLQNSVAVHTARALSTPRARSLKRLSSDPTLIEALAFGLGGAAIVAVASPAISAALDTEWFVPFLAAISVLLSFLFARAVGIIQGSGDSQAAVWWSTASLLLRVALVSAVFAAGMRLEGALLAVLAGSLLAVVGAQGRARRVGMTDGGRPFSADSLVVIVTTITFAWMTNVDVILVRNAIPAEEAGQYAAAVTLVKSGLLIPATLSLYLLPRFVRQEGNAELSRLGVRLTAMVTLLGGFALFLLFWTLGRPVLVLVYGIQYSGAATILAGLALAYVPWIVAQGLLIRMTATASRPALIVLLAAAFAQFGAGILLLPRLTEFVISIGLTGTAVLAAFIVLEWRAGRTAATTGDRP